MAKTQSRSVQSENQLLARLPPAQYQQLSPYLQAVPLELKKTLYHAFSPIDYVYFPVSGVVSAMTIMEDGSAIEVATIGNEGLVGLSAFIGGETSPNEVMVQVEGDALRMQADVLRDEASRDGPLRRLLVLYHTAFQTQISFSVACNGLHKIEKRCCRWLLMTHDRVGSDVLPLTHEFLAIMLGVRRPSVTEVLQPLQEKGLIKNERGKIIIVNRSRLAVIACECYRRTKEEYTRLLG